MGSGASASQTSIKDFITSSRNLGLLSEKDIQTFIDKETDLKSLLKQKFNGIDFNKLNNKDIDHILDNMSEDLFQKIQDRIMGKGYKSPSIIGGKSRRNKRRTKKTNRKTKARRS